MELEQKQLDHFRALYTDSPALHPHLLLGSLHLLFWLFIHPSAWRNYIQRITAQQSPDAAHSLPPDFALLGLERNHWQNPALRHLLVMGYVMLPLMTGILIGLLLLVSGVPLSYIPGSMMMSIAGGLAIGIIAGMSVSVASGIVLATVYSVTAGVTLMFKGGLLTTRTDILIFLIAVSLAASLASGVAAEVSSQKSKDALTVQIAAGAIAFLVGIVLGIIAFSATIALGGPGFSYLGGLTVTAVPVLPIGLALWMRKRQWFPNTAIIVLCGLVSGFGGGLSGMTETIPGGVTSSILISTLVGISFGFTQSAHFTLPYQVAERIAGPWVAAGASALEILGITLSFAYIFGDFPLIPLLPLALVSVMGFTMSRWMPILLYPLFSLYNRILYEEEKRRRAAEVTLQPPDPGEQAKEAARHNGKPPQPAPDDPRPSLLIWHTAFWDEHQPLRLTGLDDHLVLVLQHNPHEGQAAIEYLSRGHQRWAAQRAQIELDAQHLERCKTIHDICQAQQKLAASELEGPASALLRIMRRTSQDVHAALNLPNNYSRRLDLRRIEQELDNQLRSLRGSSEVYSERFIPIFENWRRTINQYSWHLEKLTEDRQEIDSPYVTGVPLGEWQEIFVGRTDIGRRIERILNDRQNLSLILYGQRRMGKTSLLNNLGRMLPDHIVPLFVDMQGPVSQATDHAGLLYNIANSMIKSARKKRDLPLPAIPRELLAQDPFSYFDVWLNEVEAALRDKHPLGVALLALDEFEALDHALSEGRFDGSAVLGMLRNMIQHRQKFFKVLLAGSHTLEELQHWSTYLVGVQTMKLGYLKREEARQLVERPVQDFPLRYAPDASQRVLNLTREHPFLLQLLCNEVVTLKNEQTVSMRRIVRIDDVDAAATEALESGSFFFGDIQTNQVSMDGSRLLHFIALRGEGAIVDPRTLQQQLKDDPEPLLRQLLRRDLIERVDSGYRFQVELIRRWFADENHF